MALSIAADPIPLAVAEDGVARIRGTRVTLDTIVDAFESGATAEEIVQQYPAVALADVYAIIAYYLRRSADVKAYVAQRHELADDIRIRNEARFDPAGIRERLLARRQSTSQP
jgi:uncharacterized protein (DUF433 family)